ncbi:MAG: DUF763 domain-containing protein [Halodesulfurarchaeum sp.]
MPKRGTATLPLHGGHAPRWLFDRMVDLGEAIVDVIIAEYGHDELLRRLADPYWFQALGCVLGFDWHSSGVTTTTMGALKEALDPEEHGVLIAGGKGQTSRQTPDEIDDAAGVMRGLRRDPLKRASRMAASVDNSALQDTFEIYHHTMIVVEGGTWAVVQQGMNDSVARRYHWLSEDVSDFVVEPQSAIASQDRSTSVLDLTASTSEETREVSLDLVKDDPERLKRYVQPNGQSTLDVFSGGDTDATPHLEMPAHHELRLEDLSERAIDQLQTAYEYQPEDYEELLELDGIGKGSLRALALIAELVYDAEAAKDDPAKYSFAHGGKDGTPYMVDRERYDRSIEHVRRSVEQAAVDRETRQSMLHRLQELDSSED